MLSRPIPTLVVAVSSLLVSAMARAETYDVGPGRTYENIGDVPLGTLAAGDVVEIHWRAEPYREKFVIAAQGTEAAPVVIRGVANGAGELPVISGDGCAGWQSRQPKDRSGFAIPPACGRKQPETAATCGLSPWRQPSTVLPPSALLDNGAAAR